MRKIPASLKEELKSIPDRYGARSLPRNRVNLLSILMLFLIPLLFVSRNSKNNHFLLMPSDGEVVVERVAVMSDRNIKVWVDGEEIRGEDVDGVKLFELYLPPGAYSIKVMDGKNVKEAVVYVIGSSTADRG